MTEHEGQYLSTEEARAAAEFNEKSELNKNREVPRDHSFGDLLSELDKAGYDKKRILGIGTDANLIGHGGSADVYKIPGVDKYVLRAIRGRKKGDEITGELKEVEDVFPELNIGQAVGKIAEEGIYFLRMQKGIPAGVPHGAIRRKGENSDPIYEDHLKRASEMPQSAYDEFARMLLVINERDYQFDPSKANNVLIDVDSGKFNLVDINPRGKDSTYKNSMADMAITLMDNSYAWRYKGHTPLETYRKIILDKCIEAGQKVGWQIPALGENSSLDYSFKLAGQERTPISIWKESCWSQRVLAVLPSLYEVVKTNWVSYCGYSYSCRYYDCVGATGIWP